MTQSINFPYEYDKYVCDKHNVKDMLSRYGVAIIPNLLNNDECNAMENGMWNTLGKWSETWNDERIIKSNPSTWRNIKHLYPKHGMLIQQWGIGHAQWIWDLRQNPKCIEVFSTLWNCEPQDLLCSFDAAAFHMPSEVTNIGWRRKTEFHCDQSYKRNDFECVQSWVTAFDIEEGDATLAFMEGSHNYHKQFADTFETTNDDWHVLKNLEEELFYLNNGCEHKCIKVPKGSMVLWDSRTIHCGTEPLKGRLNPKHRCVAYLCYLPRQTATPAAIKKRINAFETLRTTTHTPNKPKMFPKMPRTYGAELKHISPLDPPVLNNIGKKLVGYN